MDLLSGRQIDVLGERLRTVGATPTDLEHLRAYRTTFQPAYERTMSLLRSLKHFEVLAGILLLDSAEISGRAMKSSRSIIAKLQRQRHLRLSQMQDISGCRLVVSGSDTMELLASVFRPGTRQDLEGLGPPIRLDAVDDRRGGGTSGYRALHWIVVVGEKRVEVQIRTQAQHVWANISEKLADRFGDEIKYGGDIPGKPYVRRTLDALSEMLRQIDDAEAAATLLGEGWAPDDLHEPVVDPSGDDVIRTVRGTRLATNQLMTVLAGLLEEIL